MRPYVLAIDPGVTIGLSLLKRGDGSIIETGTIDTSSANWRNELIAWLVAYDDEVAIVAEAGPSFGRHNRAVLEAIEQLIVQHGQSVHWLTPSRWKGHPAARMSRDERRSRSQHERDATGMGRVWITKEHLR